MALLVLPGIVDVHGDAFERQVMPRPRVAFPLDIALLESDRQAVSNGITTVFHGVTWSWEPGLRGAENARAILAGIERIRPRLGADTRYHLRHETYNLDAEPEINEWLAEGRIDAIAFNDHMSGIVESADRAHKLAPMIERSGLSREDFLAVVERTQRRASEVPASIERLAAAANAAGTPLLSHDDTSPQQRRWFRSLGCRLAEFPTTVETAEEAASQGDDIVLGAPNVVRGGSHTGWIDATKMIERGLCSVLASDYYYPAPLLAAFALAARGVVPLEQAWMLVSRTPARAVRLPDRGTSPAVSAPTWSSSTHRHPIGRGSLPRSYPVASCIWRKPILSPHRADAGWLLQPQQSDGRAEIRDLLRAASPLRSLSFRSPLSRL